MDRRSKEEDFIYENYPQLSRDKGKFRGYLWATSHYLTALMHSSNEKEFEIDLRDVGRNFLLDDIGFKLDNKKLIVRGDIGNRLGYKATNSDIILYGNAQNIVGNESQNSKIYIFGNYEGLSPDIRKETQIFQKFSNKHRWKQIYPKSQK